MTAQELASVRNFLAQADARADEAEQRAARAETERDQLRVLLARSKTSLAENFNNPAVCA